MKQNSAGVLLKAAPAYCSCNPHKVLFALRKAKEVTVPTATAAQINVRLDRELKEAGDRQLQLAGYSPSQAVRALWGKVSKGGDEARAVIDAVFEPEHTQELSDEAQRKLAVLERTDRSWDQFAQLLGRDPSTFTPMTDEEMLEVRYGYLAEKYGE